MKLIFSMMSFLILMNYLPNITLILVLCLIFIMLMFLNFKNIMIFNNLIFLDKFSLMLIMLTFLSIVLIMISSSMMKEIMKTIIPILIILNLTFSMSNMIMFYMMFELVLIPTMMLIMKSGKQPERLQASIYLMIYTITASLPLLVNIVLMNQFKMFNMSFILIMKLNMIFFFLLAFLAKMPMFFLHIWLPKAHVEAPLEGSMILAAVLLKLGGYGLIRFLPLCIHKINKMNSLIISISLIGTVSTSLNCIRQKDLKSLIAYSSVAHMAFILISMFSMNYIGLMGAMMMMIAHGFSSSALFLLTNDLYMKFHTRNISCFKGLITLSPNLTFWWFMFMAVNISAPPTINTISEIFIMSSMIYWNNMMIIFIIITSIMITSFSMMMFLNLSHNKNEMLPSNQTNFKTFLSLVMHISPLIFMLLKLEMMMI